jgi:hypothetical protein
MLRLKVSQSVCLRVKFTLELVTRYYFLSECCCVVSWSALSDERLGLSPVSQCQQYLVELSLSYGRRSVDQFILVSGSPLGPMTRFYPYLFFSDNCFIVLHVGRPLWREDGSVTYSAIADWSGHWGPITIQYSLIWDCTSIPTSSPLTTRRDYGGGILTRLHTGMYLVHCQKCNIWSWS